MNDWKIIKHAFKSPAFYRFMLFNCIYGFLCPQFESYRYQYMMEVYKINSVQYGSLQMIKGLAFLFSFCNYQCCFKSLQLRTSMCLVQCILILGLLIDIWQFNRCNVSLGISDYAVLCFGSMVLETVVDALIYIPFVVMI